MAIRRVPNVQTTDGEPITVARWIEYNLGSPFANAVFEVATGDSIQDFSEVILEDEGTQYLLKIKRFQEGENLRVSGSISKRI